MHLAWKCAMPSQPMKLVLLKLADCANDDGENIFPSVEHIQTECDIRSESTVREALAAGPLHFMRIMEALGSNDGREIAMEIEALRLEGALDMATAESQLQAGPAA